MMARRRAPLPTTHPDHRYELPVDFDARNMLRNQRRRLKTQEQRLARESAERARFELAVAAYGPNDPLARVQHAVADAAAALMRTVAASYGIDITVDTVFHDGPAEASTDFKSIQLRLPYDLLPDLEHDFDPMAVRRLVALMKGLGYHELGHLRFTTPFHQLVATAIPRDQQRRTGPRLPNEATMRDSWMLLEDQRMEAALIAESPIMADYMCALVMRHLTARIDDVQRVDALWLIMAGRSYLPTAVRADLRDDFVGRFGAEVAAEGERIVRDYMQANDAQSMVQAVLRMVALRKRLPDLQGVEPSSRHRPEQHTDRQPRPDTVDQIARSASPNDDRDDAMNDEHDVEASDEHADPDASEPGESTLDDGRSEPSGPSFVGLHHAALERAEAACHADSALDATVAAIYERCSHRSSSLAPAVSLRPQLPQLVEQAERAAHMVALALQSFTVACAPSWQSQQPRGVIDPFAYRTRASGSRDYHRAYHGTDQLGLDIAVSLLLDVSGSMHGNEYTLAAAAFASKRGCEYLDIPCTVTLFHDHSRLLWSADDPAEHVVPRSEGGTDPSDAAAALDEQRAERRHHLVLVLTDGEFSPGFPGFGRFARPGRSFLGLALGTPLAPLREAQVHEAIAIASVDDLPTILAAFLTAYLR